MQRCACPCDTRHVTDVVFHVTNPNTGIRRGVMLIFRHVGGNRKPPPARRFTRRFGSVQWTLPDQSSLFRYRGSASGTGEAFNASRTLLLTHLVGRRRFRVNIAGHGTRFEPITSVDLGPVRPRRFVYRHLDLRARNGACGRPASREWHPASLVDDAALQSLR